MKLFQTGSATVVDGCQKFFHFLPITCQIDIRTAKSLKNLWQMITAFAYRAGWNVCNEKEKTFHVTATQNPYVK